MIEFKTGDIFESDAEALVNAVNCVGVMGRGIALQFKNKYPENFKAYQQATTGIAKVDYQFSYQTSLAGKKPY